MYPRVAEVLEEVAARSESLARRSRPLSRVIHACERAYAMAYDAIFTSSQPVNSAFSQLVGSRSLGARRWGSNTFSEMERLERLFQGQLEVTSSSLWLMSGILAMLKRDGFQPSDPALFNSALSAVSAALSRQGRTAAAGATFVRAKSRESLLAHTTLPVPESQKHDLTVAPGSSSGLFDSELLSEVVAQVHSSSQISSNLALSRSLRRGRSTPSSSSPLTGPRFPSFARGRPSGKRSSSSSRAGSRKRFRGGKGGGSFFWALGFPEVGAITFPDPFRRLSVPPLAGLEGQGCGALGGRGAAGRLLSAFPQHPSTFQCSAPNAFLQPQFHQGCCSGGGHLGPRCQGCCGACSSPFSRLLQPSVRSVEDLGVLASSHRPLPSQSLCGCVSLSDGDHSVCSPLGTSGGLDGLHRSQGSVSAGASPSCFSSSSALRLQGQRLSVQSSLLWPLHGSAGLHQGHGSCFRHSPFYGDPHEALLRRLARPVILSRIPRAGFADSPPPLSRVGDCRQSSKVQPRSIPGCPISRSDHRRPIFQGFSIARTRLQASVNSQRISVLHLASRELMALAAGRPFFAGSPSSWRLFANAISPALPPPVLGSSGSPGSGVGVSGMSPRPPVVAPPSSPVLRDVSLPGVSRPSLLVGRLGRGVRCPSRPWDSRQAALSINARELLAVQLGLRQFQSSLQGRTVAVFCDNTTAVAYLRKEGGTRSPLLNSLAQEILHWTVSLSIRLAPQFLPGVLADTLSRPHQLPHSEWSLNMTVFWSLRKLWLVQIDLFATSDNRRCSIYFSPFHDPMSAGTDAFLQSWDGLQAYAFPPVAIIPHVLAKLRASTGTELTLVAPHWAQCPWFSDLLQLSLAPPVVLPSRRDLLRLPRSRHLYPDLPRLRLHAWRLSSGLPELLASPPK